MLYYIAASIGLMCICKYGSIFADVRTYLSRYIFLKELFKCSLCLGFWCGVIILPFLMPFGIKAILFPFVSAVACWVADILIQILQGIDLIIERILNDRS